MKQLFLISLMVLGAFWASAQEKPSVITTVSMVADMAENIFGDKADVKCLVPIGGDPHLFEPTPRSAKMVNEANLVLKNGIALEGKWLDKIIENSGTKAKIVAVTQGIDALDETGQGAIKDPHAWMSAKNAIVYAQNILAAAKELLPKDATYFEENFQKYKTQLEETDAYILEKIKSIPKEQRILVTSHDAFQYYGKRYGIQLHATMGVSTEADVQTSDIIDLQKVIRKSGVPAIFVESTVNPKLIKQIAKDNGVKIGGELYADSLGEKGSEGDTYIKMMRHNTDVITNALAKPKVDRKTEDTSTIFDVPTYVLIGLIGGLLGALFFLKKKKR